MLSWSPWHFSFPLHEPCFLQSIKISSAPTLTEVCDTGITSWPWQQCHQYSCMFQGPPQLKSTLSTYQQRQDTYGILTPPGFLSLAPDGSDSTLQISFSNLLPDPALNAHYATSMLPTADSPSTAQREINPKFLRPQVSRGSYHRWRELASFSLQYVRNPDIHLRWNKVTWEDFLPLMKREIISKHLRPWDYPISTKHRKNCDQMSEVGNAGHEQRQIISA